MPALPDGIRTVHARGNQLTDIGALPASLRTLNLKNNNFSTIPAHLASGPATAEIDLRGNPLPTKVIDSFLSVAKARAEAGLPVPKFKFDFGVRFDPSAPDDTAAPG